MASCRLSTTRRQTSNGVWGGEGSHSLKVRFRRVPEVNKIMNSKGELILFKILLRASQHKITRIFTRNQDAFFL